MNIRTRINIVLFVIATIGLSLLIPTSGMFKYEYKLGNVWSGGTIVAPYDFPVLKSNEEYKLDIDNFKRRYQPVYSNNRSQGETLSVLSKALSVQDTLTSLSSRIDSLHFATYAKLNEIYNVGIVDNNITRSGSSLIKVITGSDLDYYILDNLYSIDSAREAIEEVLANATAEERAPIIDMIDRYISPNIVYNEEVDNYIYDNELGKISTMIGNIKKGMIIINNGDVIDNDKFTLFESLRTEHNRRGANQFSILPFLGNLLFVSIVLILSYFSLSTFDREFLKSTRNVLFLLILYISFMLVCLGVQRITFYDVSLSVVPLAIFPIYLNYFFGSKISIYQYIFVLLIVSLISTESFQFLMMNYLAGMAGMYALHSSATYKRGHLIRAAIITLLVYIFIYTILTFMEDGEFSNVLVENYMWFAINVVLLLVLYQLIYPLEKLFRFVSNTTLMELNDTNNRLLRDLSMKAPGTFQHVLQVANLSETAAKAIGANHILARTGALYHDIGKMSNPQYFIENNIAGGSPHDSTPPLKSAEIIREHVTEGVKLAKKHNLPNVVIDFITTHHGQSLIYYFYKKHQEGNLDSEIDETLFRYDGEPPHTKETTICMMADSIEAASRTLKEYSYDSVSELVERIVNGQESNGLLVNSPLTFAELVKVKEALKDKLVSIYHSRIEYPK